MIIKEGAKIFNSGRRQTICNKHKTFVYILFVNSAMDSKSCGLQPSQEQKTIKTR